MKKILKYYGLPKSGTNVLHYLLQLNFPNYVCDLSEHGIHFLGWKHGLPPNNLEVLEELLEEEICFIFMSRNIDSWKASVLKTHIGAWEFPYRFQKQNKYFVYYTPGGLKTFESLDELYWHTWESYYAFCAQYPNKTIVVEFEDFKTEQAEIVKNIQNKFNLSLLFPQPYEVKKQISSTGRITDKLM